MNENIGRLYKIANKQKRIVIGLMSGTSVDGLDVALCEFTGTGMDTDIKLLRFATVPYGEEYKQEIGSIFSKRDADLEKLTLLNGWIAKQHAAIILSCLNKWNLVPADIDLIASHGQSIFHAPKSLHRQAKFAASSVLPLPV